MRPAFVERLACSSPLSSLALSLSSSSSSVWTGVSGFMRMSIGKVPGGKLGNAWMTSWYMRPLPTKRPFIKDVKGSNNFSVGKYA